jgi:hypothetical protein
VVAGDGTGFHIDRFCITLILSIVDFSRRIEEKWSKRWYYMLAVEENKLVYLSRFVQITNKPILLVQVYTSTPSGLLRERK